MAKPALSAVASAPLADPPYPSNTKAGSFNFELDWARVKQSRTWRLCPVDLRNSLLRIWAESWNEVPCGSWEDDPELISIACDIPVNALKAHWETLMAGWRKHSDGRLYHKVIAGKVVEIQAVRGKWKDKRKSQYSKIVSGDTTETLNSISRESQPSSSSSSSSSSVFKKEKNKQKKKSPAELLDEANIRPHCVPDILLEWVEYKQESSKPYKTARGVTAASTMLAEQTPEIQSEMVTQAIAGQWQGLHPPKNSGAQNIARPLNSSQRAAIAREQLDAERFGKPVSGMAPTGDGGDSWGSVHQQGGQQGEAADVGITLEGDFSRETDQANQSRN